MSSEYREWAARLPLGALVDLDDAQQAFPDKTRNVLKTALSRLSSGDTPLLERLTRGFYSRLEYIDPSKERRLLGAPRSRVPLDAYYALPWRLAGPGAGWSGPYVMNKIGWSTQVSPRLWVALVGRPPQRQELGTIFVGRSNTLRRNLTVWEASLLEALRCFDDWSEISWDEALERFRWRQQEGFFSNSTVRRDLVMETAKAEKRTGSGFLSRCADLVAAATPSRVE